MCYRHVDPAGCTRLPDSECGMCVGVARMRDIQQGDVQQGALPGRYIPPCTAGSTPVCASVLPLHTDGRCALCASLLPHPTDGRTPLCASCLLRRTDTSLRIMLSPTDGHLSAQHGRHDGRTPLCAAWPALLHRRTDTSLRRAVAAHRRTDTSLRRAVAGMDGRTPLCAEQ